MAFYTGNHGPAAPGQSHNPVDSIAGPKAMSIRNIIVCAVALMLASSHVMAKSNRHKTVSDDFRSFIEGNAIFTIYHEIGHALIYEFGLPVLGNEEDAVDNLATVLMIPEADDAPEAVDRILAAASGWLASHLMRADSDDEQTAYSDEHGLDMQRFYSTICLLYGADPETFGDLAEAAELPEYRRDACPREYEQNMNSWAKVLEPHFSSKAKSGHGVRLEIAPPSKKHARLAKIITDSKMLEQVAHDIETSFTLPRTLTLRMNSCGEANAFFSQDEHSVTLCYELLEHFAAMSKELEE